MPPSMSKIANSRAEPIAARIPRYSDDLTDTANGIICRLSRRQFFHTAYPHQNISESIMVGHAIPDCDFFGFHKFSVVPPSSC